MIAHSPRRRRRSPSASRQRSAALVAVATLTATACATGPRPTLVDADTLDDDAASAVMQRLDRSPASDFVAVYQIVPTATNEATEAKVSQLGNELRIEIGEVVYTTNGRTTTTCDASGDGCDDFANDARVSDLGITHRFWGSSVRQRLITDAGRRIGTSTGTVATIAGQPAACVAIQVPSQLEAVGTVDYCAVDHGILGRYQGADTTIELTSFEIRST